MDRDKLKVHFLVEGGVVHGFDRSSGSFKPIRRCDRWEAYQSIMSAAEDDLRGREEGMYTYSRSTGWVKEAGSLVEWCLRRAEGRKKKSGKGFG